MPEIDVAAALHKARHAAGGPDELSPDDIGAAPTSHTHSWDQVTDKPVNFPPAIHTHSWGQVTGKPTTFAPSAHAAAHASGGSDALTPASIGAVPANDPRLLDTGWRDIRTLLVAGVAVSSNLGHAHIRRKGSTVMYRFKVDVTESGISGVVRDVPIGFRASTYEILPPPATGTSAGASLSSMTIGSRLVVSYPNSTLVSTGSGTPWPNPSTVYLAGRFETEDPWPSTLPGTPA